MINQNWQSSGEGKFEYRQEKEGPVQAFMDLLKTDSALLVIKHTEVAAELAGQGIGRALLEAVADYSRENKLRILPVCPFAKNLMLRDPEKYGDLL